jgi:hypothetical protein
MTEVFIAVMLYCTSLCSVNADPDIHFTKEACEKSAKSAKASTSKQYPTVPTDYFCISRKTHVMPKS